MTPRAMVYVAAGVLAARGVAGALLWAIWHAAFGNRVGGPASFVAAELYTWLLPGCAVVAAVALAGFASGLAGGRWLRRAALLLALAAALSLIPWVHAQLTRPGLTADAIAWKRLSFFSSTAVYAAAMVSLAVGIQRSCRGDRLGLLCRVLASLALLDAAVPLAFEGIDGLRRLVSAVRAARFSYFVLSPAVALTAATVLVLAAVALRRAAQPDPVQSI